MIERLLRIALALAVAFVVTGRMEAAAEHCARIVAEEVAGEQMVAGPEHGGMHEATPCHGMDEAAPAAPEPAPHHPAGHDPAQTRCECIAVLAGFTSFAPSLASTHIEPYEWTHPQSTAFVSIEPSPGLRPPRTV